ncbi:hypothetical protein JYU34_015714 [Plutella xylostella]|uniref:Uncharacterized protein n=1 Tax=Plutella xylostella TaxID=51655 RepID=A0ABQ7Q5X9_PLUXY|nr:hypothetical protein JYU34_015714 [Plutella xylostella]
MVFYNEKCRGVCARPARGRPRIAPPRPQSAPPVSAPRGARRVCHHRHVLRSHRTLA